MKIFPEITNKGAATLRIVDIEGHEIFSLLPREKLTFQPAGNEWEIIGGEHFILRLLPDWPASPDVVFIRSTI